MAQLWHTASNSLKYAFGGLCNGFPLPLRCRLLALEVENLHILIAAGLEASGASGILAESLQAILAKGASRKGT